MLDLAPPESALPSPATHATLLADCRIEGTGERAGEGDEVPFEVFESNDAAAPAFVIAHPEHAHVAWRFPARADDGRTRARIEIGGQAHVRYAGFANLYGRTFTTKARMDSVTGHLWARAGSPIEMMSDAESGTIFARVATPFAAPKTIVVSGNCADVVYAPDLTSTPPKQRADAINRAPTVRLFASPTAATSFATITAGDRGIGFEVLERREDFAHVAAQEAHIGIDAWVRASDISEISGRGFFESRASQPPTQRMSGPSRARVKRDTPLFMGDAFLLDAIAGAFVEKDAMIVYDASAEGDAKAPNLVAFSFEDFFIVAPEGKRLWIARDALAW